MNGGWAIGIDVGGTKIAGGLVRLATGEVGARRVVPTSPERGGEAVLADVVAVAGELSADGAARGGAIQGIGVGVPELVDLDGVVRSGNVIGWEGLPVTERLGQIAPVVIETDVRAAARAEARYGAGRAFGLFAYVTVGTGISCCLVQDGAPFAGARGNALVLASAPMTVPSDTHGVVSKFVLEDYASGPALVARYRQQTGQAVTGAEAVLAAAGAGDEAANEIVRSAGETLGSSVGFLVNVLDPAAVIVGGGLGLAGGLFWERLVESTRAHVWSEATRQLPILPAALGADAGLIGAAATAATAHATFMDGDVSMRR
jgi:glucokinase